jgi:hypothetical protein
LWGNTTAALHKSSLPTILVATKCDNPESSHQINADGLATVFPSILTDFKTSANVPGNTRDCLQAIVLAAVYNRQGLSLFYVFVSLFFRLFFTAFSLSCCSRLFLHHSAFNVSAPLAASVSGSLLS